MMKERSHSKAKQLEWEKLLMNNQIYMGDHMTRNWLRSEKESPPKEDVAEKTSPCSRTSSIAKKASPPDSATPTRFPISRSQYSVRMMPNGKRKLKSGKEILSHHNITEKDMLEWQESFDSLLNSPAGRYVFKLFLESEIADENLKFWLACEELKNTKQKRLEKRIQDIYDTYINVYSPHEINIDYKMREEIVDQLKYKMDVSVFTEAQHQIYSLMHRDSYPRFLSSPFTAELTKEIIEKKEHESKALKKSKDEISLKSTPGLISCCYCRHDSEYDVTELVEDQNTASTSVVKPAEAINHTSQPVAETEAHSSKNDSSGVPDKRFTTPSSEPASSDHRAIKQQSPSVSNDEEKESAAPTPSLAEQITEKPECSSKEAASGD